MYVCVCGRKSQFMDVPVPPPPPSKSLMEWDVMDDKEVRRVVEGNKGWKRWRREGEEGERRGKGSWVSKEALGPQECRQPS